MAKITLSATAEIICNSLIEHLLLILGNQFHTSLNCERKLIKFTLYLLKISLHTVIFITFNLTFLFYKIDFVLLSCRKHNCHYCEICGIRSSILILSFIVLVVVLASAIHPILHQLYTLYTIFPYFIFILES